MTAHPVCVPVAWSDLVERLRLHGVAVAPHRARRKSSLPPAACGHRQGSVTVRGPRAPDERRAGRRTHACDAAFAADPRARRHWFYERTPYFDPRYRLYPIWREVGE
ncbi:MAG TPA: hypothetical protein VNL72_00460 [Gammaproteobacteria bacterium]|nr:hypothetical protein [Gammaproteobacteria bacterium]